MNSKNVIKAIGKTVITLSSMVAVNEVIGYHANPYKSATNVRLACNVAGYSIGFVVGQLVGDKVVDGIEALTNHYIYDSKEV